MAAWRWHGIGPTDLLYVVVCGGALLQGRSTRTLQLAMTAFAALVVVVGWGETRKLLDRPADERRSDVVVLVLTVPMVLAWFGLATRPVTQLEEYFALLAGFFFLQAVRDGAVLSLTPIDIVLRGYVNLVAVYIVLGAAAGAVSRLQVVLVVIAFLVYFVRKSFQWTSAVLDWLVPESQTDARSKR